MMKEKMYIYYTVHANMVKLYKEGEAEPFRTITIDALLANAEYYCDCKEEEKEE